MFVFVHKPSDYILYAGINVFASVGSNILNALKLSKYVDLGFKRNQKYELFIHLAPIVTLFLYNATTVIFTSLDQVMLGFIKANESVGYYAAAIKIQNILVSLITALGAVMLPKISYALKNEGREHFENMIRKSFEFIIISAIPMCFLVIILSKEIILVLAGKDYFPAIPMLQFLMPSLIFIGLSSVTAWQLLIPLGKEKYTVIGALAGVIVNLGLNSLMIPAWGGVGAAIASTLAELAVLSVHLKALKEIVSRTFEKRELLIAILSTFITSGVVLAVKYNILVKAAFFACVVYGSVFVGVYGVSLLLFKEKLANETLERLKAMVIRR